MVKRICENCAEYSPGAYNTDEPYPSDCNGLDGDTVESERLIDAHFDNGVPGCPAFKLRSDMRLRERVFRFYYNWRESRYWDRVCKEDV